MSLCGGLDLCFYSSNIGEIRTGQPLAIEDSAPRHHPSFPHFHLAEAPIDTAASQHLFERRFDFKNVAREVPRSKQESVVTVLIYTLFKKSLSNLQRQVNG
jgi:hypothetical protein